MVIHLAVKCLCVTLLAILFLLLEIILLLTTVLLLPNKFWNLALE